MAVYYHYANFTKHERFAVDALGGGVKLNALGHTLASRAFHLMLIGVPGTATSSPDHASGRWAGDSIAIVGDDAVPDWDRLQEELTDIEANAIMTVYATDGFDQIGEVAHRDSSLFMELSYLISTRQGLELDPHMKRVFGSNYLKRYEELCQTSPWFKPRDLVGSAR